MPIETLTGQSLGEDSIHEQTIAKAVDGDRLVGVWMRGSLFSGPSDQNAVTLHFGWLELDFPISL